MHRGLLGTILTKGLKPTGPSKRIIQDVRVSLAVVELDQTEPVKPISATYSIDYDINQLHTVVIQHFNYESRIGIEKYQEELKKEKAKLTSQQSTVSWESTKYHIKDLKEKIKRIKSGEDRSSYEAKAQQLLKLYNTLGSSIVELDFSTSETKTPAKETKEITEDSKIRHETISAFVSLAKVYIQVDIIREFPTTLVCHHCKTQIDETKIQHGITMQCDTCYQDLPQLVKPGFTSESLKSNNVSEEYEDRDNIWKKLQRFQCKQENRLYPELEIDLAKRCNQKGLPTPAECRALKLNVRGRRGNIISIKVIRSLLKDIGHPELYEDNWLIAHVIFGWAKNDCSHLEATIMNDYDKTQKPYKLMPKKRTSSLGTEFRLFKHLELRGFKVKVDDFNIAEATDSFDFHEASWQYMTENAGDPEIHYIPTII